MKKFRKSISGSGSMADRLKALRKHHLNQLPELPKEISRKMIESMNRGEERTRTEIHTESQRTLPEKIFEDEIKAKKEERPIEVGSVIEKEWEVRGQTETIIEKFIVEEKLSSKRNISGDVWRAKRYWNGKLYGDVVLKTPKRKLVEAQDSTIYTDMMKESQNLDRFEEHPNILSASGRPFEYGRQLVIQTEYQPWSITDYLLFFNKEEDLTAAVMSAAMQCLDGIAFMANKIDEEGPHGWVHVDFKRDHIHLDYVEDENGKKGWVATIIDMDSVIPIRFESKSKVKFNRASVCPEKFEKIHTGKIAITAESKETVYSLGLSLLYAMAVRFNVALRRREFKPFIKEKDGSVLDKENLEEKIIIARSVDEENLLKLYYVNRLRRIASGKRDEDPEEIAELIERCGKNDKLLRDAQEEVENIHDTVHPSVFVGIRECIRQYIDRYSPELMLDFFERLWESYSDS